MSPEPQRKPPFKVPLGIDPIASEALRKSGLDELYELNQKDFFAVIGLLYLDAINDPDPGALLDPDAGFDAFSEIVTWCFTAAPSQRVFIITDEKGRNVNFFGEAIMNEVDSKVTLQELYASSEPEKHPEILELVKIFARFIAIEFFHNGLHELDIEGAWARIKQLLSGSRKLKSPRWS